MIIGKKIPKKYLDGSLKGLVSAGVLEIDGDLVKVKGGNILRKVENDESIRQELEKNIIKNLNYGLRYPVEREIKKRYGVKPRLEYVIPGEKYAIVGVRNRETNRIMNFFIRIARVDIPFSKTSVIVAGAPAEYYGVYGISEAFSRSGVSSVASENLMNMFRVLFDNDNRIANFKDVLIATDYGVLVASGNLEFDTVKNKTLKVSYDIVIKTDSREEHKSFKKVFNASRKKTKVFMEFKNAPETYALAGYVYPVIVVSDGTYISIPVAELNEREQKCVALFLQSAVMSGAMRVNVAENDLKVKSQYGVVNYSPSFGIGVGNSGIGILPVNIETYDAVVNKSIVDNVNFRFILNDHHVPAFTVFVVEPRVVLFPFVASLDAIDFSGTRLEWRAGSLTGYGVTKSGKLFSFKGLIVYSNTLKEDAEKLYKKAVRFIASIYRKNVLYVERMRREFRKKLPGVPVEEIVKLALIKGKPVVAIKRTYHLDVHDNYFKKVEVEIDYNNWVIKRVLFSESWGGDKGHGVNGRSTSSTADVNIPLPDYFVVIDESVTNPRTRKDGFKLSFCEKTRRSCVLKEGDYSGVISFVL